MPHHIKNIDDICFIALKMEKNGEAFYRKLASMVKNKEIKDALTALAEDEKNHGDDFAKIYKEMKKDYPVCDSKLLEKMEELNSIADKYLFTEEDLYKMLDIADSEIECINCAINCERGSILFYERLKQDVDPVTKEVLEKILAEELKHKEYLEELKKVSLY